MSINWQKALNSYHYPCDLAAYAYRDEFPNCFHLSIEGDRESTIAFENRFRRLAPKEPGVYREVVFWKMCSQSGRADNLTGLISDGMLSAGCSPTEIWERIRRFTQSPTRETLKSMRSAVGVRSRALPTALTFPAFADPERFPMVDSRVATWVNCHLEQANGWTQSKLRPFRIYNGGLTDSSFENYLDWVSWCREMAARLSDSSGTHWRARDVEMAVFAGAAHITTSRDP